MQRYEKHTLVVDKLVERLCNRCGGPMLPSPSGVPDTDAYGLHADVSGGFGSTALTDMTEYHFDLCEPCLTWLFTQFRIPVTIVERDVVYDEDTGEVMETGFADRERLRIEEYVKERESAQLMTGIYEEP